MAIVFLYSPLRTEGETFTTNQLRATSQAFDISFTQHYCNVGEFAFSVPVVDKACAYLYPGIIIAVDGEYWGIVRELDQVGDYVTVMGEDLNGILAQRITLYPDQPEASGLQGYDAIKDVTTEALVKYFVNGNAVNPADPMRKIIGLEIAEDQGRGVENDAYMTRFEVLSDVLTKNLELREMGWRVTPDLVRGKYVFDVYEGIDRTGDQYDNPRVVFDVELRNALSIEYILSAKSERNIFYASLSKNRKATEALTCMYARDDDYVTSGIDRREQHLNVSMDVDAQENIYNEMRDYALKDAEQYDATRTITVEDAGRYVYGVDYALGDIVTVQASGGIAGEIAGHARIITIDTAWLPSGGRQYTLTLGDARFTVVDVLNRKINNEGE